MVTSNSYKNDSREDSPKFSYPEDYEDNISNEELPPELMSKESRLEISTEKIIVIDNIPKVGVDKKDKLKKERKTNSNTPNEANLIKQREKWTDTRFQWSHKR